MTQETKVSTASGKLTVRRDLHAVRELIRNVKDSPELRDLGLLRRRRARHAISSGRGFDTSSVTRLPIHVIPADFDGRCAEPVEDSDYGLVAVATYLSRNEIDFVHDRPLVGDHAIVAADLTGGSRIELLLEIRRPNVERPHTYMSGGRFIGIIDDCWHATPHRVTEGAAIRQRT